MFNKKVQQWVHLALEDEDLTNYNIEVHGKTNKDDGYMGNVTFVTVSGENKDGKTKILDLVIKSSKESDTFRKQVPLKDAFEKEIFIYDVVQTVFNNFQREIGIDKPVEVAPHCYATQATGTSEVLILENLKPKGYQLWDRKTPMDFDHTKLVLETFGKWHALSLAVKTQKPDIFEKLTRNTRNTFSEFLSKAKVTDFIWEKFDESREHLIFAHELEALKKLDFNREDVDYIINGLFFEDPKYHVFLHGDCWTNNFLFQYNKNSTKPLDMRLIDWQMSGLGSPVLDLSYFFYCCCWNDVDENLEEWLQIYYDSLTNQLKELGSDPEEVFSFNTLMRHWRRFSRYGVIIGSFILRFSLCEEDDAPDFAEAAEQEFALKHEALSDLKIEIHGRTNKDEGYFGNITFITVSGKTKTGTIKVLDLVIKSSQENKKFRKQVPIKEAFENEVFVYNEIISQFEEFQKRKGIKKPVTVTPYCYAAQATGTNEALILENLKPKGYQLWNRKVAMTFDHVRIVLEAYGKWHALSLALKTQQPEVFEKLARKAKNMFSEFILKAKLIDHIWEKFNKSKERLVSTNESADLKKLQFSKEDVEYVLSGLFSEEPTYQVFVHGDAWTNNFLFKLEENTPTSVCIIDWQFSSLGSPIIDISNFLYCCCPTEDYEDLEELLQIYHKGLTEQLRELGSNSEEVFPFNILMSHWRKFSRFGLIFSSFILRFSLCEADDAPDFAEAAERGEDFLNNFYFAVRDEDAYFKRVKHNLLHYARHV
ncbi:EcKinase, DUF1679, and/or APH domain containing protein [Asbolus verrucosus]|uniref:EcKinase, DUF1679, and/or APH domain containing protein n=1 Tax=Asbolus verrucosus TaxID=1661398 RepID=A0A482VE37_ASBVE|nr:EcKinase, DUF1679, and/or APH domain containing protein [Asbolus verrucosus]